MQTFLIAPVGLDAGLTSVSLGLVRALERDGLKVGFIKPIAQGGEGAEPERSSHFARELCHLNAPTPISMERAEHLLSQGQLDQLLEEVVSLYQQVAANVDVVIVEGLVQDQQHVFTAYINSKLARTLQCEVVLVGAGGELPSHELAEKLDIAMQAFSGGSNQIAGYILNRLPAGQDARTLAAEIAASSRLLQKRRIPCLGGIPLEPELMAPRTLDVANYLRARLLHAGQLTRRRVLSISVMARSVPHIVHLLKPGALVIVPGDREDVILATAMAAMNGVPLAGLLLTCGAEPDPRVAQLCHKAFTSGMPVLSIDTNTLDSTTLIAAMNRQVPADDLERMERVVDFVAEHLNTSVLQQRLGDTREKRLSPPAFRYQLMEKARRAAKRIVLPEGNEPRTVKAAAICQEKGIAHCVLLGDREEIAHVAEAQGIVLPPGLEIVDPNEVRASYVAPMVALRKNKGLNAPMAEQQLEDNVVLGTMMLALNEVDGLVSGAVHTTANTIRPALQLIKTAPGAKLVSSVFFMLMPDQVLVYGDCAVNPDPSAEELADIAIQSADSAAAFGIPPRVAMISYSTGASGSGDDVEKVREATRIARDKRPGLLIDGPMQYDAASVESVGRQKAPDSPVAGCANVFVFPDLNTGNTTYKAVQRSAGVVSVGPMLQGLKKPVNDLSRGALVDDIVYTIALTAIQAEQLPAQS